MTPAAATAALLHARTVTVMQASLQQIKELHARCLSGGIPAAMQRPESCGAS